MRRSANVLVTGKKESGKTTLARELLRHTRRAVVLDRLGHDYPEVPAADTFEEFAGAYRHVRGDPAFQLRLTDHRTGAHLAAMRLVSRLQEREELPPVGLFMEEASFYSSTGDLPDVVDAVSSKGRHWRISTVVVTQRATQVHPLLFDNSDLVVTFRLRSFPQKIRELWPREELEEIKRLEEIGPDDYRHGPPVPVKGTHYLVDPPEVDVLERWREAAPC
ncbi:MAG: hypothetical protein ACOC5E_02445 [Acidobacteriota bacterium]